MNESRAKYDDDPELSEIRRNDSLNRSLKRGAQEALAGHGHFLYSMDKDFQFKVEELEMLETSLINDIKKDSGEDSNIECDEVIDFPKILMDAISAFSEREYFTGWKTGIEYELWELIHSDSLDSNYISFSSAHRRQFKILSKYSQGWIHYDKEKKWVPLKELAISFREMEVQASWNVLTPLKPPLQMR